MASNMLPDALWNEIEPLFPRYEPSPEGGCLTAGHRPSRRRRQAGPSQRQPKSLVADKGFDSQDLRALIRWLGIKPLIPRRGDDQCGLGKVRWIIERTLSWFHQFRRLRIRWERNPDNHQVFLSLAATLICYRIWNNAT